MSKSTVDFTSCKHIHFTGIKGVGMTALALCAKDMGIKVTGSDVDELFVTDETLKKAGIKWKAGFWKTNIEKTVDLLITTGAHGGFSNPEVLAAKKFGIPTTSYAEALADLANEKDIITVVGIGGKTTTCSILAVLLDSFEEGLSFVVGVGEINPIGMPGRYSSEGKYFICEGDDYVVAPGSNDIAKFLLLDPKVVVVTNIEHDHPDIYKNTNHVIQTFRKLFKKIPRNGLLVACVDNKNVRKAIDKTKAPIVTYGFSQDADWKVSNVSFGKEKAKFRLTGRDGEVEVMIKVPGKYNILNATAAFIVGKYLEKGNQKIISGLSKYLGCKRRFEKVGEINGVKIYDDYAHHPEEIKSLLKAAREWFPKNRIVAVFQPHTYSRTKALFREFSKAFSDADSVAYMDIYASAREVKDKSVDSAKLAKETSKHRKNVFYLGNHKKTVDWLKKNMKQGDVIFTIGAGDIFHLHKHLIK